MAEFLDAYTYLTLLKTSIFAPESRPSQAESSLSTFNFQGRAVSYREDNSLEDAGQIFMATMVVLKRHANPPTKSVHLLQ